MTDGIAHSEHAGGLRTLAMLSGAGLSPGRVVRVFAELAPAPWSAASDDLRQRVSRGASFTDALTHAVPNLPAHSAAILQAGESTGDLAGALDRVASDAERTANQRREMMQAIAYPSVLITSAAGCVIVITMYVLPQFQVLLGNLGRELPSSAKLLLSFGRAAPTVVMVLVIALVAAAMSWRSMRTTDAEHMDRWLLGLPLLGRALHVLDVARLSNVLANLFATRVPPAVALGLGARVVSNRWIASRLTVCRQEVLRGKRVAAALEETGALPRRFSQLIRVGEEGGSMASAFAQVAALAEREYSDLFRRTLQFLEPMVVLGIAGFIGAVAAILMTTMYSIRSS